MKSLQVRVEVPGTRLPSPVPSGVTVVHISVCVLPELSPVFTCVCRLLSGEWMVSAVEVLFFHTS